jgi:cytochrome c5
LTQVKPRALQHANFVVRNKWKPRGGKESAMIRATLMVLGALAASSATGSATAADGKAVWDKSCAGCHAVMAPKTSDKAAWAPLVKRGAADLTASTIKGKGAMPPKGGAKTDEDVKAAVDYIISQMK